MVSNEPQFATVTILIRDSDKVTLRVPIKEDTTVRRLAKESMQRLLARSAGTYNLTRETISVVEVFVNTASGKAEIFAQDLVTQVVLVKEEVIHMRLHVRTSGTCETSLNADSSLSTAAVAAASSCTTTSESVGEHGGESRRGDVSASAKGSKSCEHVVGVKRGDGAPGSPFDAKENAREMVKNSVVGAKRCAGHVRNQDYHGEGERKCRTRTEVKATTPKLREMCSGNIRKNRPANSASGSGRSTVKAKAASKGTKAAANADGLLAGSHPQAPLAGRTTRIQKPVSPIAPEVKALLNSRLGWGREASRYFPENYTGSPDKIPRLIREAKRREQMRLKEQAAKMALEVHDLSDNDRCGSETTEAQPTVPASKDPATPAAPMADAESASQHQTVDEGDCAACSVGVERQLFGDGEETSHTPASKRASNERDSDGITTGSKDLTSDGADTPLPAGWGKNAVKYFDARTYCDDPTKAKLSPDILAMPLRAGLRRSVA